MGLLDMKVDIAKLKDQHNTTTETKKKEFKEFKPVVLDKTKTTYKLRILPNMEIAEGTSSPYIDVFNHYKDKNGNKIFTPCPKSWVDSQYGECPICERSWELKKKGDDGLATDLEIQEGKNLFRSFGWACNVLIIEDPRQGSDNQTGEVLPYKFGKQIFEVLEEAWKQDKIAFWGLGEGNTFNLVMKPSPNNPIFSSYVASNISETVTPVTDTEEKAKDIMDRCVNLHDHYLGKKPTQEYLTALMNGEKPTKEGNSQSSVPEEKIVEKQKKSADADVEAFIDNTPAETTKVEDIIETTTTAPVVESSEAMDLGAIDSMLDDMEF